MNNITNQNTNTEPTITDLPDKKLLRVDEAAIYFDVDERTIREWIRLKKLVGEKLGGTVRISRQSIINFRLAGTI